MKCFYCGHEASAKIGGAKGNIFKALLGWGCWTKTEKYVCTSCFKEFREQQLEAKNE